MTITVRQLADAVNNRKRIDINQVKSDMTVWEIDILNQYCHIIHREYHEGWYQEEAERIAREKCSEMHEFTWQVIRIKN